MMRKKILAMAVGISLSMPLWSGVVNASVFTAFYNEPDSIFADGNTHYKKLQTGTVK